MFGSPDGGLIVLGVLFAFGRRPPGELTTPATSVLRGRGWSAVDQVPVTRSETVLVDAPASGRRFIVIKGPLPSIKAMLSTMFVIDLPHG